MKAKFKVNDEFRLKKDETFNREWPQSGYNPDGSVHNLNEKVTKGAGSVATVYEVRDSSDASRAKARYWLDFGDLKFNLNEQELLELFEPVERH